MKTAAALTLAALLRVALASLHAAITPEQVAADQLAAGNMDTTGFDFQVAPGPVKPNAQSLGENYHCPDWFRDAKFGIYMHWGLNSIPGFNGHYARNMYHQQEPAAAVLDRESKGSLSGYTSGSVEAYEHHVKTYGHPSKFGYKDFIPMWKADKFDAMALAALYKACGAKYIGAQAVHCDNFDLYDSTFQPWNSVRMGPHLDVVAAWQKACAKEHLRFAITSHLSNNYHEHLFYQGETDATGPLAGIPYDTMDPKNDGLYGKRTPDRLRRLNPEFAQSWYHRTKELIDKYNPDLIYLDGGLPNGAYGLNLAAHFYNHYLKVNGKPEGVFTIKRTEPKGFTLDVESAGIGESMKDPWQVDTTLNSGWFYMGNTTSEGSAKGKGTDDAGMSAVGAGKQGTDRIRLAAGQVIDNLVDIVSKNGNMLLNVGLRADGSLPDSYRDELLKIGAWLKINGEAIYATRPFKVFGEGPFHLPKTGGRYNDNQYRFTAEDIRFTTAKDGSALYAIVLDVPKSALRIKSLAGGNVAAVTLVGSDVKPTWKQEPDALVIEPVTRWPSSYAVVFKIVLKP